MRHVNMRQGVLGLKVKIMLPFDATGANGGCTYPIPDQVKIIEPKTILA